MRNDYSRESERQWDSYHHYSGAAILQRMTLMRQVEKYLDREGSLMTVQFMASEEFARLRRQYWPAELVGPSGPLHDEFIAMMAKIKARGDSEHGGR